MDVGKLFKGQKIDLTCPGCSIEFEIDGSQALGKNQIVTCPNCDSTINLENNDSVKNIEKELKKLKKMFK